MEKTLQDVRDFIAERFGSPFWLSVTFSWLILNYPITITAIYQKSLFNPEFVKEYLDSNSSFYWFYLPILLGAIYSIFSKSFREFLEVLAKSIRSWVANLERVKNWVKSYSQEDYEKQIKRLSQKLEDTSKLNVRIQDLEDELRGIKDLYSNQSISINEFYRTLNQYLESPRIDSFGDLIKELQDQTPEILSFSGFIDSKIDNREESTKNTESSDRNKANSLNENDILFRTLLLLRDKGSYDKSPDPENALLSQNQFNKGLELAEKARFIESRSNDIKKITITNAGVNYLERELRDDKNWFERLGPEWNEEIKKEVIKLLKLGPKDLTKLRNSISWHYSLMNILSELKKDGVIHSSGDLWLLGKA